MLDDLQRLRDNSHLCNLLARYADLQTLGGSAWQNRLMQMEGVGAVELVKLHGELIAMNWIEQNSGQVVPSRDGSVPGCYRITKTGVRDLQRLNSAEDEDVAVEAFAKTFAKLTKEVAEPEPFLRLLSVATDAGESD